MPERRILQCGAVPCEIEAILEFGDKEIERLAKTGRPLPEFHHCPYLGFIGKEKFRVGRMLHPMAKGNR